MAFDPDAFLADTAVASPPFDPDKFLSEPAAFDPDAFLAEPKTRPAGHPDRYEELGTTKARADAIARRSPELQARVDQENYDRARGRAASDALGLTGTFLDQTPESIVELQSGLNPEFGIERMADDGMTQGRINLDAFKIPEGAKTQEDVQAAMKAGEKDPIIQLPTFRDPTIAQGLANAVANLTSGLTTPENLALMAPLARAPKLIQQGASLGFGTMMLKGAYDQLTNAPEGETPGQKTERISTGILSLLMAGAAAKHGVDGRPVSPLLTAEREASMREARERVSASAPTETQSGRTVTMSAADKASGYQLAEVPAEALEAAWSRDPLYIDRDLKGADATKIAGLNDWLAANPDAPVEVGSIAVSPNGTISFVNGRHRTRMMVNEGNSSIPVAIEPGSIANAKKAGLIKDATAGPDNIPVAEAAREPTPLADESAPSSLAEGAKTDEPASIAEPAYAGGPGAMGPVEAGEMAAANRITGTKNEQTRLEREARGEEEIVREQPIENRESINQARAVLAENPNRGAEIVERLKSSTQDVRTISATDEAILMAHKVELMKQRAEQDAILADGNRSPEEHVVAKRRLNEIEAQMNDVDQATYASGAEWGRMGQLRQRLLREDYSFEAMEQRARIKKGDALTPEESTKIKEQAARIAELEKQLEAKQKEAGAAGAEAASEEAFKEIKKKATPGKEKDLSAERDRLSKALEERVKDGDKPEDLKDFVQRLALNFVRSGVNGREALIDAVHGVLSGKIPNIERSQTRDLISGYGEFRPLDKEPAKVTLRGLKGEMQQLGKIEDMQKKVAPKKTGMERREITDEERRLQKEVNELKKKGGFTVTDPATQLKTAMEAIKTRLRNEIRDLDAAMATQERIPGKKSSIEYDAEAAALKAQRDAKRAQYDELFPKEQLTQEQQLTRTGAALDRSITQLEADLKAGKLYGETGPKLTSPQIEAKLARLAALREERQTLRDLDTATVEAKREAQLQKAIENAQKAIPDAKEGAPTVDSERIAQLKQTLQEARDARASSPEAQQRKIEAATESVRKSIAEYDRRLREGDTSRASSQDPLRSNELDTLRNERDALERAYREMVAAEKPKKSREEIALQAYKSRTATRIAELEERIANGNFDPKPKVETKLDREALDLKVKVNKVKQEYDQRLRQYERERRTKIQKAVDAGLEILGSVRGLILGSDIGVLTRQGLFAWSRPVTALRATAEAFKSAFSPESMARWEVEIRDREINGRSASQERKKAGLRITDTLDRPEELVVTRLLSRLPDINVGGKTVRISEIGRTLERFQTTFINAVRADLFDAAIRQGFTPEELKLRANFINSATGSSNLKMVPKAMSAIFTSPRYEASRWEMLAQPVRNIGALASSASRGQINRAALANLKDIGITVASIYGVFKLAEAAGYGVNWNPSSSDFLKMRKGDEVWDVSAGMAPRIRDIMRMFIAITHPSYRDNAGKVLLQAFMRAINPGIKTPVEQGSVALQRSEGNTKPILPFSGFKSDAEREGWITLAPLIVQNALESAKGDPASAAFSILREFIGMSVSRYPESK